MKTNFHGGVNIPKKTTKQYANMSKIPVRKCLRNNEEHYLVGTTLEKSWGVEGNCIKCSFKIKFNQYCGFCAICNLKENRNSNMHKDEKAYNGPYWWCAQCCEQEASEPEEEQTQWNSKWDQSSFYASHKHSKPNTVRATNFRKRKASYYGSKKKPRKSNGAMRQLSQEDD